uniref:WD repeat domain 75 n=1 Tax=Aotus nancymaae TaxID=37293 RepID=A0A2K5DIM6_AOTNA
GSVCGGDSEVNFGEAVFLWYIFCVSGDFVKVYSTATEECVHILHGHRNLVTGIQLNPNNHLQVPLHVLQISKRAVFLFP